jgi:transcriptional regulator with XRE-family HTH domain
MSSYRAINDNDISYMLTIMICEGGKKVMIAQKIKKLREARNWSQAELARRVDVTRNGVNSWEQGLSMPSPACLVELAKVFSVSTDYLLGIESLERVNVSGLDSKEVALLTELADMLRNKDHK